MLRSLRSHPSSILKRASSSVIPAAPAIEGHWRKRRMVGAELERGFGQRMQTEHVARAMGSRSREGR